MKKEREEIKEEDIEKQVRFKIAKGAFEGPFVCCGRKTKKLDKSVSLKGLEFNYNVWQCSKCKKEYLDSGQAKRLERFWTIQKILEDNLISIERKMNYDGKTYFFRFPKELTTKWEKGSCAGIKVISPETFLIEVKQC